MTRESKCVRERGKRQNEHTMPHIFVCFFYYHIFSFTVFNFIPESLSKPNQTKTEKPNSINCEHRNARKKKRKRRRRENSIKQTHNLVSHLNCSMSNIGCSFYVSGCVCVCICRRFILFFSSPYSIYPVLAPFIFSCV